MKNKQRDRHKKVSICKIVKNKCDRKQNVNRNKNDIDVKRGCYTDFFVKSL